MKKIILFIFIAVTTATVCSAQYARWAEIETIASPSRRLNQYCELNNRASVEIVVGSLCLSASGIFGLASASEWKEYDKKWKEYGMDRTERYIYAIFGGIFMMTGIYELGTGIANKTAAKKGIDKCKLELGASGLAIKF